MSSESASQKQKGETRRRPRCASKIARVSPQSEMRASVSWLFPPPEPIHNNRQYFHCIKTTHTRLRNRREHCPSKNESEIRRARDRALPISRRWKEAPLPIRKSRGNTETSSAGLKATRLVRSGPGAWTSAKRQRSRERSPVVLLRRFLRIRRPPQHGRRHNSSSRPAAGTTTGRRRRRRT